jgi:hypothetical protein
MLHQFAFMRWLVKQMNYVIYSTQEKGILFLLLKPFLLITERRIQSDTRADVWFYYL